VFEFIYVTLGFDIFGSSFQRLVKYGKKESEKVFNFGGKVSYIYEEVALVTPNDLILGMAVFTRGLV